MNLPTGGEGGGGEGKGREGKGEERKNFQFTPVMSKQCNRTTLRNQRSLRNFPSTLGNEARYHPLQRIQDQRLTKLSLDLRPRPCCIF